ncbi:MAG: efflux RND transporter periplasmic adaptor subunit [Lachnospiraceae bacterium]|nr:efflux RND transporter periplasmic adaptor subunit [Lachnospiraceae bacterium]
MKKHLKLIIIIIAVAAAAAGGLIYYLTPDPVRVVAADTGDISPTLKGTGKLEGDRGITVYSDVAGTVSAKYAGRGDRVKKGDLLLGYEGETQQDQVEIAETDVDYSEKILDAASENRAKYQAKYNKAVSDIENCKTVYALLESSIMAINISDQQKSYEIREQQKVYQNDILKMQTEISDKQADLAKVEADLKGIELKGGDSEKKDPKKEKEVDELVSKAQDYQDDIKKLNDKICDAQRASLCLPQECMDPETYKQYTLYQNQLETVTRLWSEARTDKDTAQSMLTAYTEIYSDEQQVEQNKLSLDKAQRELDRALGGTVSPADGIITECLVDVGAYVEKGVPVLYMQSASGYKVKMMVSKYDIDSISEGQKAEVRIGDSVYEGTVEKINQSAENDASGKAKVIVEIGIDTDKDMIVGLDADVTLELKQSAGVVRIPSECIYTDDGGSYVYVVNGKTLEKKYITTGLSDGTYTEIKEGINPGGHVVMDPDAADYEGETVKEEM